MQVLCIGSAVLDITASCVSRKRDWAEKQRIDSIRFTIGGDAVNQCVRMADAGLSVGIVSAVGTDRNGILIKEELIRRKVQTDYLRIKPEYPTGTALVLLDEEAQRTVFSVRGAYCELEKNDIPDLADPALRAVSIAGLFTEPKLEADGGMLELLCRAQSRGILTFADLASDKLHQGFDGIRPFLPHLDYFLPSLADAAVMNGTESPEENAAIFRAAGCPAVIIKCGEDGAYVSAADSAFRVRTAQVQPVDTTGAGDCMAALLISRILKGERLEQAVRYACLGATYSTLSPGASAEPFREEAFLKWRQSL